MILSKLPNDILENLKIPVNIRMGTIFIGSDIYSYFIVIKNCGTIAMDIHKDLRDFICLQLKPSIDYQVGSTWEGVNWNHGPLRFPLTSKETLRFVLPAGDSLRNIHQKNNIVLNKLIKLVSEFSSEITVKFDIFENSYDIYYTKDKPYNFNKISKTILGEK